MARLAGRGTPDAPAILAVRENGHVRRLPALPGPAPAGDAWRAAFALPAGIDPAAVRFALALADGALLDLPNPQTRRLDGAAPRARLDALAAEVAGARRQRDAALKRLAVLRAELDQRAEAQREAETRLAARVADLERAVGHERERGAGAAAAARGLEVELTAAAERHTALVAAR